MKCLKCCIAAAALAIAQSTTIHAAASSTQMTPIRQMRPWIVAYMPQWAEMPPAAAQNTPAPAPQPIQGRIPDAPGYPTASNTQRDSASAYNLATLRNWTYGMGSYPLPGSPDYALYRNGLMAINQAIANGTISGTDPAMRSAIRAYNDAYASYYNRAVAWSNYAVQYDAWYQREMTRYRDEQNRLYRHAYAQWEQNVAWNRMVEDRFNNTAWDAFNANNGALTTLQFESIYANYNSATSPPTFTSLSAAGNSPSSVGNSLSSAGTSLSSVGWSLSSVGYSPSSVGWSLSSAGIPYTNGTNAFSDPMWQSLFAMGTRSNMFGDRGMNDVGQLANAAYRAGNMEVRSNFDGRESRESGGYVAASLFTHDDPYLRQLMNNGFTGLDRLLAQPFNVILTWGQNSYDLDLHMTGPLGEGSAERFHIYFSAEGDLESQPYAALIKDCVCNAGSEVILTTALNGGGVYRVSVFNYGDDAATSTNLANASEARIQIVRGGTTQSVGNGTTIVGGHTILDVTAPAGQPGNTWTAVELDPANGRITVPRRISQSNSSGDVP